MHSFCQEAEEHYQTVAQLERLPEQNARRSHNAEIIRRELADVTGLTFQSVPDAAAVHTNYLLLGRIGKNRKNATRADFHQAVSGAGIPCTPFYPHPLYGNPLYQDDQGRAKNCRVDFAKAS